jgi:hypothetical protein
MRSSYIAEYSLRLLIKATAQAQWPQWPGNPFSDQVEAGIGQQLADPEHPEALVAPQRKWPGNTSRRLDPAGAAHS